MMLTIERTSIDRVVPSGMMSLSKNRPSDSSHMASPSMACLMAAKCSRNLTTRSIAGPFPWRCSLAAMVAIDNE